MCVLPLLSQAIGRTCREGCERARISTKHLGSYVVKDATGQTLAYVYARETRADADTAKVLTMDEARRIAVNIAKLPARRLAAPD